MRKRTFFHCCDQNAKMQLNWYLRYQTIDYDRLSKSRATADRRGSKSLSEQQGLRCTNQSSWKTNHSRASCFIRSHITSRPHRLKKTSSMQSKRGDLHHKWLHRETNEKLASPRGITTTFSTKVSKLSLFDWSNRCAYGVVHAWHFSDVTCTSTWSVL